MRITIQPSSGVVPRLAPQLLPEQNGQVAVNARMLSGDLEAWRDVAFVSDLYKSGTINTIHLMARQHWLHWVNSELGAGAVEVDVAKGPIAGDTTHRTYFVGTDAPRVTNLAKAIGSCGMQYPCDSLLLGVPAPDVAPVLTINATDPDVSNVTINNPGAESGGTAGWFVDEGDLNVHNASAVPGLAPKEGNYFYFGGAAAASTEARQTLVLADADVFPQQKLDLAWWQASGDNGSKAAMGLRFYNASATLIGEVMGTVEAVSPAKTWVQRTVSGQIPADAATVRLIMKFERMGVGENDAYIDAITVTATDYEQVFTGESFDGWTKGPEFGVTKVEVDATIGRPAPSWRFTQNNSVSYVYKNLGLSTSPKAHIELDLLTLETFAVILYGSDGGYGAGVYLGENGCQLRRYSQWSDESGTLLHQFASGARDNAWHRLIIDINTVSTTSANLKLTVQNLETNALVVDAQEISLEVNGPYMGLKSRSNETSERSWVDNVNLSVVAPEPDNPDEIVFTNYVWTYCNEFGEEGAPSPVSRTIQRSNNAPVTIETPDTAPAGYGITHKCLYRSATGTAGSAYLLVEKVPLADESYVDTKADFDLGRPLETQLADLPPADLRGLLAMPNRFLAGFAKNELVVSEQGRYHSWPVDYRLATDEAIVAIGAIDASMIVLTEAFPYIATGYTPDAVSMRKLEVPYACSSKRSVANLKDFGIVYASPDGLVGINGQGAPMLLTEGLMTREQWQALRPATVYGIAHDDRYYGFYDDGEEQGGFILDVRQGGFGLVFLNVWAQAAYSDPLTDRLYLVINDQIWGWDEDTYKLPYTWKSKLYRLPRPTSFGAAQVTAKDYDDLTLKVLADGAEVFSSAITSMHEFRLPAVVCQRSVEVQISGTSAVERVDIAEEMEELE